ncbi:hypothetical protein FIV42_11770 [Persicimonas caeni]|uniref:Uncharacterized protein n=1 Tax=Persicimonas caeni TaxID=2292766 RepID=A0A4Y6PT34_PERCE|nr:hypothetical protein [Persicimonas caeni]QDG51393.1 hypothetical protein FIV42_11770 [Persicimonas caeni]QED32614.1 hypothetical protein FRD00_11765 [Persicimonas caeni]
MNVKLLIDTVIQQTTVLVAQLATTAGIRAPLAHVANQVFLDLANELETQGGTRKVAADMFGLALRSYQLKIQRLSESLTDRERSLWEAVLDFIRAQKVVRRAEVLTRFADDDEASVKGILRDLVESGLVFQTGRGQKTSYRAASDEEIEQIVAGENHDSLAMLLWIAVYRSGPVSFEQLGPMTGAGKEELEDALVQLLDEGRIIEDERGDELLYRADTCFIPMDEAAGWEAAVFDHFNAMVTALCVKLRQLRLKTLPSDVVGGSTYSFDVPEGHPHEDEVLALLRETRERVSALRQKVSDYNDEHGRDDEAPRKVTFYFGQSVVE